LFPIPPKRTHIDDNRPSTHDGNPPAHRRSSNRPNLPPKAPRSDNLHKSKVASLAAAKPHFPRSSKDEVGHLKQLHHTTTPGSAATVVGDFLRGSQPTSQLGRDPCLRRTTYRMMGKHCDLRLLPSSPLAPPLEHTDSLVSPWGGDTHTHTHPHTHTHNTCTHTRAHTRAHTHPDRQARTRRYPAAASTLVGEAVSAANTTAATLFFLKIHRAIDNHQQ
jgi:hypothetical protein